MKSLETGLNLSPVRDTDRARRAERRNYSSGEDDVNSGLRDRDGSPETRSTTQSPRIPVSPSRSGSIPRKTSPSPRSDPYTPPRRKTLPGAQTLSSKFARQRWEEMERSPLPALPSSPGLSWKLDTLASESLGGRAPSYTRTATTTHSKGHTEEISDAVVIRPRPFVKESSVPGVILPPSNVGRLGGAPQERTVKMRSGTITIGSQSVQFDIDRIHKDDKGFIMTLIKTHFKRGGRVGTQRYSAAQLIRLVLKGPGSTKIVR